MSQSFIHRENSLFLITNQKVNAHINLMNSIQEKNADRVCTYLQQQQRVYLFDQVKDESHQLQLSLQEIQRMAA
jgi:hypothetical protein